MKSLNPIDISNEYINWLCFANAGILDRGNLYCFDYALQNLPSHHPVVEIGSFCGLSTNIITYYLTKHHKDNRVITSDKWIFEGAEKGGTLGDSTILHSDYRSFVKESFIRNIKLFSAHHLPYAIEEMSDEFFRLWEANSTCSDVLGREISLGGEISFCYIDGNHTYEFAKRDFVNTDKYLEKDGFILFDDSSDASPFGCRQLMEEIIDNGHYELVVKNPNCLFRKKR
jgi:hypothetical protein